MTSPTPPAGADPVTDAYVAAVAAALAGVPESERQELLDDLADHLAELAAEDGATLEDRLGPPAAYAADLVASAGLEASAEPAAARPAWTRAGAAARGALAGPRVAAVRAFLPELRPGWWVLRAWCVMALATVTFGDDSSVFPIPDVLGNGLSSLGALGAAVVISVRIGRVGGWPDKAGTGIGALGLVVALANGGPHTEYVDGGSYGYDYPGSLITPDGRTITNIWPHGADGQPLDGVLLFDQDGVPIDVGQWGDQRDVTVPGLFPQDQTTIEWDEQTGREVRVPVSAPDVSVPRVLSGETTSTTSTTVPGATTTTTPAPDPAAPPPDPSSATVDPTPG